MKTLTPKFVEYVPDVLEEGALYISIPFAVASHRCPCGCGNEVVTPLSPTDWQLIFDGETVSLTPSIGNWAFRCRSHYWVQNNNVEWAEQWTDDEIRAGRHRDRARKRLYFGGTASADNSPKNPTHRPLAKNEKTGKHYLWSKLKRPWF